MKIGLISDTHVPSFGKEPPWQVARAFEGVDLILHAGDIYTKICLDWLEQIAPVLAVEFNGPYLHTIPNVVEKRVVEVEGHAIGLVHELALAGMYDEPFPGKIAEAFAGGASLPQALEQNFGRPVDIVVFGHTHVAVHEEHQGVLLLNPGSPSLPRHLRKLGGVGILELEPGRRAARLIDLASILE